MMGTPFQEPLFGRPDCRLSLCTLLVVEQLIQRHFLSELHIATLKHSHLCTALVDRRFAHQRFADSCESIRKKTSFEALGQIRANRVFSPIRIEIRAIRVQSSLLSPFLEGRFAKKKRFSFFRNENRFARIGPLRCTLM